MGPVDDDLRGIGRHGEAVIVSLLVAVPFGFSVHALMPLMDIQQNVRGALIPAAVLFTVVLMVLEAILLTGAPQSEFDRRVLMGERILRERSRRRT